MIMAHPQYTSQSSYPLQTSPLVPLPPVSRSLFRVQASDHASVLLLIQRRTVGDPRTNEKSSCRSTSSRVCSLEALIHRQMELLGPSCLHDYGDSFILPHTENVSMPSRHWNLGFFRWLRLRLETESRRRKGARPQHRRLPRPRYAGDVWKMDFLLAPGHNSRDA